MDRALVFTRTKHGADKVVRTSPKDGIPRRGDPRQQEPGAAREGAGRFKNGATKILVATDIAARGIDVDAVSHVRQLRSAEHPGILCPPHRPHRARRCRGAAPSRCATARSAPYLKSIEKLTRQVIPSEDRRDPSSPRPPASAEGAPARRARGPAGPARAASPTPAADGPFARWRPRGGPGVARAASRGRANGAARPQPPTQTTAAPVQAGSSAAALIAPVGHKRRRPPRGRPFFFMSGSGKAWQERRGPRNPTNLRFLETGALTKIELHS